MIRFLLRFVGLCMLAAAFVFFIYDGEKSLANHQVFFTRLGDMWAIVDGIINRNSLNTVQDWIKLKALWAWDPYMQGLFALPVWAVLAIVSTVLVFLGRRKKKLIGYARD